MSENFPPALVDLLQVRRPACLDAWLSQFRAESPSLQPGPEQLEEWREQASELLSWIEPTWPRASGGNPQAPAAAIEAVGRFTAAWAHEGFTASDAARFVLAGRRALAPLLAQRLPPAQADAELAMFERVLETLALAAYESYSLSRDRVIHEQSLSLIEMSSPVIKLWDRILLLPLVGVIDTLRARTITERLLESIARLEAEVTIIDVTGVPVFDTGVAGHLFKTVAAAEMLGTRVVLTGISADGAQTLVKLGVNLGGLSTCGTLRAGVAWALARTGHSVTPTEAA